MTEDIFYRNQKLNHTDCEDLNYTDEMFNKAFSIVEDMCLLITGINVSHWGLITRFQRLNSFTDTKIIRETSNNINNLNIYIT